MSVLPKCRHGRQLTGDNVASWERAMATVAREAPVIRAGQLAPLDLYAFLRASGRRHPPVRVDVPALDVGGADLPDPMEYEDWCATLPEIPDEPPASPADDVCFESHTRREHHG